MSRTLTRSSSDKVIAGVCGGLARYFGLDASLVRVAAVLLAVVLQAGWILYPALWLVMPADDGAPSGLTRLRGWLEHDTRR